MIIQTQNLDLTKLTPNEVHQLYCGLDNCVTSECIEEEYKLLQSNTNPRPQASLIYSFERALQGPYLEIMLRGFKVDTQARDAAIADLKSRIHRLQYNLNQIVNRSGLAIHPINPNSRPQLIQLFYECLKFKEIYTSKKGIKSLSLDRHTLESLYEKYQSAQPLVSHILSIRDLSKQLQVLTTDIDSDGRFRSSYNIGGTSTGRPSSSESAFGSGGNAQNIAAHLRHVFIPDPGYKLCTIDFEQSEARDIGFLIGCLFSDWTYLDSCESGDVHTSNARLIWPHLPWTGDLTEDKQIASRKFHREFSHRDMAKRGSHLTNYMGTAWTMARHLKIPTRVAEQFQDAYCRGPSAAFPSIPLYWQWVIQEIQTNYKIVTPFGRERHFFGDLRSDATFREAIAFIPQSTTSDRTNLGLWRVWKNMPQVQLLAQGYDSITFQAPDDAHFNETVREATHHLTTHLTDPQSNRSYTVPVEAKTGYNWGSGLKHTTLSEGDRPCHAQWPLDGPNR